MAAQPRPQLGPQVARPSVRGSQVVPGTALGLPPAVAAPLGGRGLGQGRPPLLSGHYRPSVSLFLRPQRPVWRRQWVKCVSFSNESVSERETGREACASKGGRGVAPPEAGSLREACMGRAGPPGTGCVCLSMATTLPGPSKVGTLGVRLLRRPWAGWAVQSGVSFLRMIFTSKSAAPRSTPRKSPHPLAATQPRGDRTRPRECHPSVCPSPS